MRDWIKLGARAIPEGIVAFLGVKEGDKLDWRMEIINGERVTVVKKIK